MLGLDTDSAGAQGAAVHTPKTSRAAEGISFFSPLIGFRNPTAGGRVGGQLGGRS